MHSGYPVVITLKKNSGRYLFVSDVLRKWGVLHEFGHNMQRRAWTFHGTGEVTCNIFTLYVMEVIGRQDTWAHPRLQNRYKRAKEYLDAGADYPTWKRKYFLALLIYAQLVHEFGWKSYKIVFRKYETGQLYPKTDQEKIDLWVTTFSEAVDYNLCPMFEFWGIPFSAKVKSALDNLTPFLPDDEITALVPDRVKQISNNYVRLVRSQTLADIEFD